jgi:hypothetical protein
MKNGALRVEDALLTIDKILLIEARRINCLMLRIFFSFFRLSRQASLFYGRPA